ncbi:RHS repeat-associated protein [Marinoscillum furvescens DSM 4134]|uniref:RHS repeat-associated protein n=2 Tax=Marinoscillum furvescens TaxID=1026 RepID=A0A3D9L5V8_MARFU|nr:RHS repeat-associated protein [Marinoscillum furvescens DSM 4134]
MMNNTAASSTSYLFNGKEYQEETGAYAYEYRHYDPVIGRFNSMDPLSYTYANQSPYLYASNNPVTFIDYLGLYSGEPDPNCPGNDCNNDGGIDWEENGEIVSSPYFWNEDVQEWINAYEVLNWDPTNQNKAYRARAQAVVDKYEDQSSGGSGANDGIWPYGSPVAWSIGVDLDVVVGVGGDMNPISYGTILQGKDKGTGFILSDGGIGVGLDVSGSVDGTVYFYTGDLDDFSVNSLNGPRVEGNFGASFFADLGVGVAVSEEDRFGGRVIAVKGFIGAGIPTYVGGNANWGETFIQKIIK